MPVDLPGSGAPTALSILNRIRQRTGADPLPEPTVEVGQVALVLDAEGLEDNFAWVLMKVTEVDLKGFGYRSYAVSEHDEWLHSSGRRPYGDVVAAYSPEEAAELEVLLRRFEQSQQRVMTVYHDARKAFIGALRGQNDTAMSNLLQDSEKLDNEIADLVSKFGVNVALFREP